MAASSFARPRAGGWKGRFRLDGAGNLTVRNGQSALVSQPPQDKCKGLTFPFHSSVFCRAQTLLHVPLNYLFLVDCWIAVYRTSFAYSIISVAHRRACENAIRTRQQSKVYDCLRYRRILSIRFENTQKYTMRQKFSLAMVAATTSIPHLN
ncbi:hypothetical protein GALMADRAFT_1233345 [Galerina marginata CBS 339.88]|uniref:Uncharacterized protein n=1 Tax=Galerina marginata (strain CBS 339.88) TaxID=685588 RepID=A0A067T853_GALM3|nr:hypothetical protein GALMADRAFT_1233345 [Galerina marginata CBS 339.88]